MNGFKFFSQNCDGLGGAPKRVAVFTKLKRKGPDAIFCLQETHCTERSQSDFEKDFNTHHLFFSNGSSNSSGVLTAIPKSWDMKILRQDQDENGRFLILDIEIDQDIFTIANIYMPTRNFEAQQIETLGTFAVKLFNNSQSNNYILGGDWNLYMSLLLDKLDTMPETNDNSEYREHLKSFLEVNNFIDVWRTMHPYKKFFTWHRGEKRSRLDYIFMSEHLLNRLQDVQILPGIQTDHSLLELNLDPVKKEERGRGFWKFSEKLLHDQVYVNSIKQLIATKKAEYQMEDLGFKWDLIKMDIRNFTIPYCSYQKKEKVKHEKELNERYNKLFSEINAHEIVPENTLNEYNSVKHELESLEREHARGIIVRSKIQFVEEGEKCTSYFLRQEKNNYNNKHITKLIDPSDKSLVETPQKILDLEKDYYKNLYDDKSDPVSASQAEDEIFENLDIPKISDQNKQICEEEFSESEILKSVKAMKSGKSPGTCGLTSEWYKFFWSDIKDILVTSMNFNLRNGKLSLEQRRGILTLIPKKDKDRLFLKNWRPLTLLNTDYKILAKALANRLLKVLPFIVEDDQTGYISGRFIGCNIRLIEDILIRTTKLNIAGILLTIDFEKAFDSLRWSFIRKALKHFNFGEKFISYVNALYNQISTTVINNGFISSWFSPKRGVRQGCPFSPYLFILSVEILAISIRQNKDISGLVFDGTETKISQLADDTTCVVRDEKSLKELLKVFELFRSGTGLQINVDKTTARCLGNFTPSREKLFGLKWTQEPVETLGVILSGREDDHYNLNFRPRICKMKQLLDSWKCRKLSIKGKVTVINSLAISKLIYLASTILVPEKVYDEVKLQILDFLWNGKTPKIAYSTLIQSIEKGGLKLIDFRTKVKSLTIGWVKRLSDNSNSRWKSLPREFFKTNDLKLFFSTNMHPIKSLDGPQFYKTIQNNWSNITKVHSGENTQIIRNQIIWNNRYITIQNKPFVWKKWKDAGINLVNDIINKDGEFLTQQLLVEKFGIQTNFLELLQIRMSLPFSWRRFLSNSNECVIVDEPFVFVDEKFLPISTANSKIAYIFYISQEYKTPTSVGRWLEIFPDYDVVKQRETFLRTFNITRETKLQSFQYQLLNRNIYCKKKLNEMRILESSSCEHCGEVDTLMHFFIECNYVANFWNNLQHWLSTIYNDRAPLILAPQTIIFGYEGNTDYTKVVNYIILLSKYFLFVKRMKNDFNMEMRAFLAFLKYKLGIERNIALRNKSSNFNKFARIYELFLE